jgi:hypothetical protein
MLIPFLLICEFILLYLFLESLYYINYNLILEDELIGLEIEHIVDNKINKINDILYSPHTDNKYYNIKYIGSNNNISNTYLFDKNNKSSFNNIIKIVNSYKYSENILNIINNLDKKLILNEISIKNAYIININNNYYYDNYSCNFLCFINLIKYFFCTHFWT